MEKKVRYLMLLLCLYMLPVRVFALEDTLEETGYEQSEVVVVEEVTETEIDNQEGLVEITDPEATLVEGEVANIEDAEIVSEESDEDDNDLDDSEEGEDIGETPEEDTGDDEEDGEVNLTAIEEITLTGLESVVLMTRDEAFPSANTSDERFTIEEDAWYVSDETTPATVVEAGKSYNYHIKVQPNEGYTFDGVTQLTVHITANQEVVGYVYYDNEGNAWIDVRLLVYSTTIVNLEDFEVLNLFNTPYVGLEPFYGASTNHDNIIVQEEAWYYFDEDGYYYENSTGEVESGEFSGINAFYVFEEGITYTHKVMLATTNGYKINILTGDKVEINGVVYDVYRTWKQSDGAYYDLHAEMPAVELTEENTFEVTENGDSLLYTDELEELDEFTITVSNEYDPEEEELFQGVYVNGELQEEGKDYNVTAGSTIITFTKEFLSKLGEGFYSIVIRFKNGLAFAGLTIDVQPEVTETTTTNTPTTTSYAETYTTAYETTVEEPKEEEDSKLEVKKSDDKEEEEEIEEESSNTGLIIFLIILIIIAIAIPVTIYRKKQ